MQEMDSFNLNIFWGSMPPDPPVVARQRRAALSVQLKPLDPPLSFPYDNVPHALDVFHLLEHPGELFSGTLI